MVEVLQDGVSVDEDGGDLADLDGRLLSDLRRLMSPKSVTLETGVYLLFYGSHTPQGS